MISPLAEDRGTSRLYRINDTCVTCFPTAADLVMGKRPGGRLGISDILAEDHLTPAQRLERGRQAGCIAGAPSVTEYHDGLPGAGFTSITITPAQQAADGVHSAIIRAVTP